MNLKNFRFSTYIPGPFQSIISKSQQRYACGMELSPLSIFALPSELQSESVPILLPFANPTYLLAPLFQGPLY